MKYHIVQKLNSDKERLVSKISDSLRKVAGAVGWKEVHVDSVELGLIVVIGGDGTMLHAMGVAANLQSKPDVVGINVGKLGFLAEVDPSRIHEMVIDFVNSVGVQDRRTLLSAQLDPDDGGGDWFRAVNEFVIVPAESRGTIRYEFFVDGVSAGSHQANGLIIATPTGSTAYSLSVGGAIIQPNAPVFQIVPIAPMSLNSRSVIVSDESEIRVSVASVTKCDLELVADGQVVLGDVVTPEMYEDLRFSFRFKRASDSVVLLHRPEWNFFEVLQKKLHWSTPV